ncbi:hypothetical protein [Holdemania massiliensis]|uniref:hypothetical protein n=1 Tax=Holdemania massiliensis TaxID=1468449 RepID=UPI001F059576|nr:hypothetical protein [Holdemania massiliensis]MCH1939445.1 hypothetical protein [Holdemania massiliensis]
MKTRNAVLLTGVGILLLPAGFVFLKSFPQYAESLPALPYICLGLGAGLFGHGLGELISHQVLKNAPERQKQIEIDQRDERNIQITNRAKGKAYDAMIYIFGTLMIIYALMNADLFVILSFIIAYLFVVGISIYYRLKFDKES